MDVGLQPVDRIVVYALQLPPVPKNASITFPVFGLVHRNLALTKSILFQSILLFAHHGIPVVPIVNKLRCDVVNVHVLISHDSITLHVVFWLRLVPSWEL